MFIQVTIENLKKNIIFLKILSLYATIISYLFSSSTILPNPSVNLYLKFCSRFFFCQQIDYFISAFYIPLHFVRLIFYHLITFGLQYFGVFFHFPYILFFSFLMETFLFSSFFAFFCVAHSQTDTSDRQIDR